MQSTMFKDVPYEVANCLSDDFDYEYSKPHNFRRANLRSAAFILRGVKGVNDI